MGPEDIQTRLNSVMDFDQKLIASPCNIRTDQIRLNII